MFELGCQREAEKQGRLRKSFFDGNVKVSETTLLTLALFAVRSWRRSVMRRLFTTTTPAALGNSSNSTSPRAETSREAASLTVSLYLYIKVYLYPTYQPLYVLLFLYYYCKC